MKPTIFKSNLLAVIFAASAMPVFAGTPLQVEKSVIEKEAPEDFPVHPITAPYWAEDSFVGTDLRPVFAWHHFPGDALGGGYAVVYAAQLRIAITKSLQFVAYKDGFTDFNTRDMKDRGWNDIAAGLKWAFLQDDANQFHAAVGVGYEFASGDDNVLQDDDGVRFWASVNKGFGRLHLGATVNYFLATDNGDDPLGDSNSLSWHLHLDYQLSKFFSPVIEVNGYHVLDEGDVVTPFGGSDVLNLGGNKHEDVITVAFGAEVRPTRWLAIRGAYELPLSDEDDLWGHRWTFSSVIRF